ncbi:hypothetical protein GGI15_003778 [Coemansia interrupta]|uniref:Uncharacterized protein n=1 Tax=Coemansia interrupta TaxID=1126814 RepID=A0A9W8LH35_9FUNG|nr:hypothetical protein GGI15_003778 [Coemansia interrupta]
MAISKETVVIYWGKEAILPVQGTASNEDSVEPAVAAAADEDLAVPVVAAAVHEDAAIQSAYESSLALVPQMGQVPLNELIEPQGVNETVALECFDLNKLLNAINHPEVLLIVDTAAESQFNVPEEVDEQLEIQIKPKAMLLAMEQVAQYISFESGNSYCITEKAFADIG